MRKIFTVLGLLLTVAIVGLLVKQQMSALKPAAPVPALSSAAGSADATSPAPVGSTQQVRDDVQKALAQGAAAQAAAASAADQ